MNNLSFTLAWRYLRGSAYEKRISTMVYVCFLSIVIGSASLALVLAIMRGIEYETQKTLQSIHAHILMRAHGQPLNVASIMSILQQEFPEVLASSPTAMQQVMITQDDEVSNVVMLRGIDPASERLVSTLEQRMVIPPYPEANLEELVVDNHVIVGKKLAENFGIKEGDSMTLLFASDAQHGRKISLDRHKAMVTGMFSTGIEEFDAALIMSTIPFLQTLFPEEGVTQINITLVDDHQEKAVIQRLRKRFAGMEVYSWKELYPALFSAMQLEKFAMFLILALITLVASMNVIALLFMQITQKRSDIAILKLMGMNDHAINAIFMYIGLTIAFLGSIAGIALSAIVGWLLDRYPPITLPDVYYVSKLPVKLEVSLCITVLLITLGLSLFSTWFSARSTKSINIAEVLRFEA
jgi:lipoprotein-releasing system permease protein